MSSCCVIILKILSTFLAPSRSFELMRLDKTSLICLPFYLQSQGKALFSLQSPPDNYFLKPKQTHLTTENKLTSDLYSANSLHLSANHVISLWWPCVPSSASPSCCSCKLTKRHFLTHMLSVYVLRIIRNEYNKLDNNNI